MTSPSNIVLDRLRTDPWFNGILGPHQAELVSRMRAIKLKPGQRLYRIDDPPDGLYAVLSGEVRLISFPSAGQQLVSFILGPGKWFGELSIIDGGPRPHDAVAVRPTCVLFLPLTAFDAAVQLWPGLMRDVARLGASHQRYAMQYAEQFAFAPLEIRLAHQLSAALPVTQPGRPIEERLLVKVTQEVIATMVGASRQAVNGKLRAFETAGLI